MRRYIDADALKNILKDPPLYASLCGMTLNDVFILIDNEAPTIQTKEVKYFDEDENVWKIGSVIVE